MFKKLKICTIALIISGYLVFSVFGTESKNYVDGEVIIKFKTKDSNDITNFINQISPLSYKSIFPSTSNLQSVYNLKFQKNVDIFKIINYCNKSPIVEYCQPNYLNYPCTTKLNDYFYPDQWALRVIDIPSAWKIEKGKADIIIAIVDSGVDYNHEDLKDRIWTNPKEIPGNGLDDDNNGYIDDIHGWNFEDISDVQAKRDLNNDPMDNNGHGTHVAGIIAAVPNNSRGTAGIMWNCRIMALRCGSRHFEDDDVSSAIVYAADNGARIINMSWGGDELSYVVRDATKYAYDRGCILVAAAGNDRKPTVIYPALHKHIIAVGATDRNDKKAVFSNYGPGLDIVAPGHKIMATLPNNSYSDLSGTSMAAPVVSGVIGLMLSKRPGMTSDEVRQILRDSADKIDDKYLTGIGRINARKALTLSSSLFAQISSPDNNHSVDKEFIIEGTAAGFGFKRYVLEYSELSDQKNWTVINYSNNCKHNEMLGKWNVEFISPSAYIVRLKVYGTKGQESEDRVILNVVHHSAEIKYLSLIKRVDGNRYRYLIKLITDNPVSVEVYYRKAEQYNNVDDLNQFKKISSLSITDDHEIYIPKEAEPGKYEYFIIATTISGFVTVDDNNGKYYTMEISWLGIPSSGFIKNRIGISAIRTLSVNTDINMNGIPEIICMESTNWEYSPVLIYEKIDGSYKTVFRSEMSFLPLDVGDSDNDGLMEILGRNFDGSVLFECPSNGQFPSKKIWEVNGIRAVKFSDIDMDGKKEIIARRIDTGDIQIYENRGNNLYLRVATLKNQSDGINYLMTDPAISDFDNDGFDEIVIGDIDGDIYIYRNVYDDCYEIAWKYKCEEYIQNISKGDFDGDGIDEFIISAIDRKSYDLKIKRWIHTVFKFEGHSYSNYWSFEISSTGLSCFLNTGDINNDGKEEIIFVDTEHIYIISLYEGAKNILLTDRMDKPLIDDFNRDEIADIILNDKDELIFYSIDSFEIIKSPWNVYAKPINENEIELWWNGPFDSSAFRIYRGINDKELLPITTILNKSLQNFAVFHDSNLIADRKYTYAISSINANGQESILSEKVTVIPNAPPKLLSAEFISPDTLYLYFNEEMGESAQDKDCYIISNDNGKIFIPSSAILDFQGKRVVLTINDLKNGKYKVRVSGISDSTGVYISKDYNFTEFEVFIPEVPVYSDLNLMKVYPNPVRTGSMHYSRVVFDNVPIGSNIKIYDIAGQLIKELETRDSSSNKVMWFLDNANDSKIASGVYIYFVEFRSKVKSGKIAVVR